MDRLPDDNFYGSGINMLRDKINELVDAANLTDSKATESPRITDTLKDDKVEVYEIKDCPHSQTYAMQGRIRCKKCKAAL